MAAAVVVACVSIALYIHQAKFARHPPLIRCAPRPSLDGDELGERPYLPDSIPGGRDVRTPYGVVRVYEWGPEAGDKVLLLGGISTPALALVDLADGLVNKGCRVMLFDYYGRGYSEGPLHTNHDTALYMTQILFVISSSDLRWTGRGAFHVIGYSFGGALAMALTSYFPDLPRSITLLAPSGLVRKHHVGFWARLVYRDGWLPSWLRRALVSRRLQIPPPEARAAVTSTTGNSDATGGPSYDYAIISRRMSNVTVADVLNWQAAHHPGFLDAFVSCMNHAPIFEQTDVWRSVGDILLKRRSSMSWDASGGKVLLILGGSDLGITRDELVPDATLLLGEEGLKLVVLDGGHEIAITEGSRISNIASESWAGRLQSAPGI